MEKLIVIKDVINDKVGPMLFKTSNEDIRVVVAGTHYRYVDDTFIPVRKTNNLIPISEAEFLSLKQRKDQCIQKLKHWSER